MAFPFFLANAQGGGTFKTTAIMCHCHWNVVCGHRETSLHARNTGAQVEAREQGREGPVQQDAAAVHERQGGLPVRACVRSPLCDGVCLGWGCCADEIPARLLC